MTTLTLALALLIACGDKDDTGTDGGTDDGGAVTDGGTADGGTAGDGGIADGGSADGGSGDGGSSDGGSGDGGSGDGGSGDGGSEDGGSGDGGSGDGGSEDGGSSDGGSTEDCSSIDAPALSEGAITEVAGSFGSRVAVEVTVDALDPSCTLPADHWNLVCALSDGIDDDGVDVDRLELSADGVDLAPGDSIPFELESEADGSLSRFYEANCAIQATHGTLAALNIPATGNSLPSIDSVVLDPAEPTSADTVTCSWEGFADDDGDEDHSTISWTLDGLPFPAMGGSFSGAYKGSELTCIVTPNDGYQDGEPVSAMVEVGGGAPSISGVRITPTNPTATSGAQCTPSYTEPDGDLLSFEYSWTINGESVDTSFSTLSGDLLQRDDEIGCTVTITDEDGEDEGSATATVGNAAPVIDELYFETEWPIYGEEDVVCLASATDPDGDEVELSLSWLKDGSPWRGEASSTYEEGDTVPADELSADDNWTCRATATDGEDSTTSTTYTVVLSPISDGQDGTLEEGDYINTKGVVTAAGANLVTIQHQDGGPYSAITVWLGSTPAVSEGDYVLAYGPLTEYYELTEIDGSLALLDTGWDLPEAVDLSDADWADADVMEPYESVLATVSGDLTVTDFYTGDDNWEIDETFWVDDRFITPDEIELATGVAIEAGVTLDAITGPVFFTWDEYRLTPREVDDIEGLTGL